MPRFFLWLAGAIALFAPAAGVWAQSPASSVSQVVSGPTGYQFQVPSDWKQVPVLLREGNSDQILTIDGQTTSPDGIQQVHVETSSGLGASADKTHDIITTFLQGPPGGGGPSFRIFAMPSPVRVPNADAAEAGAASYSDPDGNPRVVAARLAIRGGTGYMLVIDSTDDFYKNNPLVGQIQESFRLTSPSSSEPGP
jgi:hypothetical protein